MCFVKGTCLNSEVHNSVIEIDGYSVLRSERTTRNSNKKIGGGVVVCSEMDSEYASFSPMGVKTLKFSGSRSF